MRNTDGVDMQFLHDLRKTSFDEVLDINTVDSKLSTLIHDIVREPIREQIFSEIISSHFYWNLRNE